MFDLRTNPPEGICWVKWCRKKRHGKHRLCSKHDAQKTRANNPAKYAYHTLKANAKRRRKKFELTFEQFVEFTAGTRYLDGKGRTRYCYHIDRIDPARGYVVGNLQVLTCTENTVKGNDERGECPF